jgi:GntR family transcriptional regulator/MocR family aminotransferase
MRKTYAARRDALVEALAEEAPRLQAQGLAAGLHLVVPLPPGTDTAAITAAASERGIRLRPMSEFRVDGAADPPAMVFGYAAHSESAIRRAIRTVGDLLPG